MNEFQKQNCSITLQEGLDIYYQTFDVNKPSIKDDEHSGNLFFYHDCTHVIFGLNTNLDQEVLLDAWVLFGSDFKLKDIKAYMKTPQIKSLYDDLMSEYGIFFFFKIYMKNFKNILKIIFRCIKMKKKWPLHCPKYFLVKPINELRDEFGINIIEINKL